MLDGEPTTAARLAVFREAGASAMPVYASMETGTIGFGCLRPDAPDEVHLFGDRFALIQPEQAVATGDVPPQALFITSLRRTARLILLNVALGDQGQLGRRPCGCPHERVGWTLHVHTIRVYQKLTAGGMTFLDTDLARVLETVLPGRFGGSPTDYQLVEEETPEGEPRLRLLIDSRVGPLDLEVVAETFLSTISAGSGVERVMGLAWRRADLLKVERGAPYVGATGKVLHLHQIRVSRRGGQPAQTHSNGIAASGAQGRDSPGVNAAMVAGE